MAISSIVSANRSGLCLRQSATVLCALRAAIDVHKPVSLGQPQGIYHVAVLHGVNGVPGKSLDILCF